MIKPGCAPGGAVLRREFSAAAAISVANSFQEMRSMTAIGTCPRLARFSA
jgi:hypothetical protein